MSPLRRPLAVVVATAAAVVLAAAGLALPGRAGGSRERAGGRPATVTVALTARHSRFTPGTVAVPPGASVRFVVRNLDPIDHELIVGGADVHARHRRGREAHHHGDVPGEVSVPAGGTATTTVVAPERGSVAFACHLPGHLDYGMRGTLLVRPGGGPVRTRS